MLGFLRSPQQDEAQQSLDRAVAVLRGYQRAGTEMVSVADVLDLLGAQPETVAAPMGQYPEPGTDPLTGCRSVTPG